MNSLAIELISQQVGDYLRVSASQRMGSGAPVEAMTALDLQQEARLIYPEDNLSVINFVARQLGLNPGVVGVGVVDLLKLLSDK